MTRSIKTIALAAAPILALLLGSAAVSAQDDVTGGGAPPPPMTVKRIYFGPGGNTMAGVQVNSNNAIRDQFRTLQGRWVKVDTATVGQSLLCPVGQWAWIAEYGDDGPRTYFTILCAGRR